MNSSNYFIFLLNRCLFMNVSAIRLLYSFFSVSRLIYTEKFSRKNFFFLKRVYRKIELYSYYFFFKKSTCIKISIGQKTQRTHENMDSISSFVCKLRVLFEFFPFFLLVINNNLFSDTCIFQHSTFLKAMVFILQCE